MKNKTRLLSGLVIALISIGAWFGYQEFNKHAYSQYLEYTGKAKIDDYQVLADGKGVLAHWVSTTPDEDIRMKKYNKHLSRLNEKNANTIASVGNQYIVRQNIKLKSKNSSINLPLDKDEYWTLSIYHLTGNKLNEAKEIDLYEIIQNYDKEYVPVEYGGIFVREGKEFVKINIEKLNKYRDIPKDYERHSVFIDLESYEVSSISELKDGFASYAKSTFVEWNSLKSISKYGLVLDVWDRLWIQLDRLDETIKDTKKELLNKIGSDNSALYLMNATNSSEQSQRRIEIYNLFLPRNVNLYQNTVIPANLTIDSQEHIVDSKEEFDKYYDIEKAKKAYHETE
ncbi:hypothetical protein D8808_00350 [Streptococcus gordonii]|uniref:hypothetical protein n=1 Tax=Streptococcus gordonii TaxID=1302 RepID=UPI000F68506F|nr:hypothetical protein [Streptococcus gordonii]RSJ58031.1 hypothetical protein D8808_00350 [Streptococcus gordonii]